MISIPVEKLTEERFRKYGEFQDLTNNLQMQQRSFFSECFYADLIRLDLGRATMPSVSCCHVKKSSPMIVDFLENHANTCEGLLPIDDDVIIYVGAPGFGNVMRTESLHAFYIPKWTFVKLNGNVIHGGQFPVHQQEAHLLCILPAGTYTNDCCGKHMENDEEKGIIIYDAEKEEEYYEI